MRRTPIVLSLSLLSLVGCDRALLISSGGDAGVTPAGDSGLALADGEMPPMPLDPLASPYPEAVLCPEPSESESSLSSSFAARCAGCHGASGEGGAEIPSLRAVTTLARFVEAVRTGPGIMPAFAESEVSDALLARDFDALRGGASTSSDPLCGAGYDPRTAMGEAAVDAAIERGLVAWRRIGPRGSCAGCHTPDAIDLAWIGYSEATLLRRAAPHVSDEDARAIVELVRAQRERHRIARPLHPTRYRPLQPGFEPLEPSATPVPGTDADARDMAFLEQLRDARGMRLVNERVQSLADARALADELASVDLRNMRTGLVLDRWTEDGFHGDAHLSPNEWIPGIAREAAPGREGERRALVDAYLAEPSDRTFWAMYDRERELTVAFGETTPLSEELMARKHLSVQVLGHMLRMRRVVPPDFFEGATGEARVAMRSVAIERNPFWSVGDAVRQHPMHCDQPDPCTTFPPAVDETIAAGNDAREVLSEDLQRAWFWLGWQFDPAILFTEDSRATITGDYFLARLMPRHKIHHAFLVARLMVAKAEAGDEWLHAEGTAVSGHGRWASPRPFVVTKHVETQFHQPATSDPRYAPRLRMFANAARMSLFLVHDELGRTGEVYRRDETLAGVRAMRTWIDWAEPGEDHAAIDALLAEIEGRIAAATDIDDGFSDY